MTLAIRPLHEGFVAEIDGLDLAAGVDDATVQEIWRAIDRYAVLVFHGQRFDDDSLVAFGSRFGELQGPRSFREKHRLKHGVIADISNLGPDNRLRSPTDRKRVDALGNQLWHTDSSFRRVPAILSMLFAHVVPPAGGETEFADLRAAWDALDDATKARIDGLVAEHSIWQSRAQIGFTDFNDEERASLPPVPQKLVRTHPGSGRKTLYLAAHASHILGWEVPEGRLFLRDLMDHATQRAFAHRHTWRVGDLVIWDNRCTMHRGRPYDPAHVRDLRRVTTRDVASSVELP